MPTVISGLLFAPMIFQLSNSCFEGITGFSESESVYLRSWLPLGAKPKTPVAPAFHPMCERG